MINLYDLIYYHYDDGSKFYIFINGNLHSTLYRIDGKICEEFKKLIIKKYRCKCGKVYVWL